LYKTHAPIVKYLFEEAENYVGKSPCATILLSSVSLEAALYRKLLSRKVYLKHYFNICDLEHRNFNDLIEYAERLQLLDSTNRKTADRIREARNCIVHLTNRNLERLAKKYPDIFHGIQTHIYPSGEIPRGEQKFKAEVTFFAVIRRLSKKILADTKNVLDFLDKK